MDHRPAYGPESVEPVRDPRPSRTGYWVMVSLGLVVGPLVFLRTAVLGVPLVYLGTCLAVLVSAVRRGSRGERPVAELLALAVAVALPVVVFVVLTRP